MAGFSSTGSVLIGVVACKSAFVSFPTGVVAVVVVVGGTLLETVGLISSVGVSELEVVFTATLLFTTSDIPALTTDVESLPAASSGIEGVSSADIFTTLLVTGQLECNRDVRTFETEGTEDESVVDVVTLLFLG